MPESTTKYKKEYDELAYKLCLLGSTDAEMADIIGVTESTIALWKTKHRGFSDSIARGKEPADAEIAGSLRKSAEGFEHKGQYYPPNERSIRFWLMNRRPKDWREKTDVNLTGSVTITAPPVDMPDGAGESDNLTEGE